MIPPIAICLRTTKFLLVALGLLHVALVHSAAPPTDGLFVWLKADAGVTTNAAGVTEWRDQSPAGHPFSPAGDTPPTAQPADGAQPAAIAFSGRASLRGSPGTVLSAATVFTVVRYAVENSDNDYVYAIGASGAAGSQMTLSRRPNRIPYHFDGSAQHLGAPETFPSQQWVIAEQIYGGGSPRDHALFLDSRSAIRSAAGAPYAAEASQFVIGDWSSRGFRFVGELAEFLVYNRVLSLSERREVNEYLRGRAGLPPAFANEAEILSEWEVVQYELNAQPDARWIFDLGGTRADQPENCDPSILLSSIDVTNKVVWGQIGSGIAPDSMGFVFGYQDRGHYYLFDWKKTTASYQDFGAAPAGMRLRAFHVAEGDPSGRDFWSSPDTNRVTVLRTNSIPWDAGQDYRFTLQFTPGHFTVRMWESEAPLETWTVNDSTYGHGRFGYFVNSLQDVRFGEVLVGDLVPPTIVEIHRQELTSSLRWLGGVPPYQLERSPQLATGGWQREPALRWLRSALVPDAVDQMFYRIISVGDVP